jgi:hypothetical protein
MLQQAVYFHIMDTVFIVMIDADTFQELVVDCGLPASFSP